jgi:hypothetical protein
MTVRRLIFPLPAILMIVFAHFERDSGILPVFILTMFCIYDIDRLRCSQCQKDKQESNETQSE